MLCQHVLGEGLDMVTQKLLFDVTPVMQYVEDHSLVIFRGWINITELNWIEYWLYQATVDRRKQSACIHIIPVYCGLHRICYMRPFSPFPRRTEVFCATIWKPQFQSVRHITTWNNAISNKSDCSSKVSVMHLSYTERSCSGSSQAAVI